MMKPIILNISDKAKLEELVSCERTDTLAWKNYLMHIKQYA